MTANMALSPLVRQFLDELIGTTFTGEISDSDAQRTVYSTDNSVYVRRPQAIVFPRTTADIAEIMRLAGQERYRQIVLTARGGGTGTNGQSLTDGIVVDVSRFMNQIVAIDVENRRVHVQAGVVKDQLNAALKPHGLFFAPELSTSNRATIGGMINTDASGQGSLRYGKTHDHVLGLTTVLLGGEVLTSQACSVHEAQTSPHPLYQTLCHLALTHQAEIEQAFPKLTRALTGYDLPNLVKDNQFNINAVLCGAEGSLGIISEAVLNVLPIPKHRALINIGYTGFQQALEDANALLSQAPLSIETIDSKVLNLAKGDIVWENCATYFPDAEAMGINLMELNADDAVMLEADIVRVLKHLQQDNSVPRLSVTVARGATEIGHIYAMRKRAVGLLGNVQGEKRPQPFVEDTAVPPEHLADYIRDFRAELDKMGLDYGMFGHVDAGVLHVRPQLDTKDPNAAALLTTVTERVVELTHRYGGVLWGEHGKGLRSQYAPTFFGATWPLIRKVKTLFDPYNQLNPGKIAVPEGDYQLTPLTAVTLRGEQDKKIPSTDWHAYGNTMHCNGNGACYNFAFDDPMCPSWKISRDRAQSPKGRAMLVKEWLRRKAENTLDDDFEQQTYQALHSCLSCKSCAGQCPVKVDIPDAKARFLHSYFKRHRRPWRDYLIANLESLIPLIVRFAPLYNRAVANPLSRYLSAKLLKLSDAPTLHATAKENPEQYGAHILTEARLQTITQNPPENAVILIPDAFTRYFDTPVFMDWVKLLTALGVQVYIQPFRPNGKPMHVHGFLDKFNQRRDKNEALFARLQATGLPLIGLDPAMTLVYRQEYRKDSPHQREQDIYLPQEWLHQQLAQLPTRPSTGQRYYLAGHCTEKTQLPASTRQWQAIFAHFGLSLEAINTGCCGMAGTYGHETEHQTPSLKLYQASWQDPVQQYGERLLTTGYSCRSQAKRFGQIQLKHPAQVLLSVMQS